MPKPYRRKAGRPESTSAPARSVQIGLARQKQVRQNLRSDCTSPALQKSTIFWGTLGAILAAVAILGIGYALLTSKSGETDTDLHHKSGKKNTAVDVIDGFKSLKLGMPRKGLEDRLMTIARTEPNAGIALALNEYDDRLTRLLPEEEEWAGIKIKDIYLTFDSTFLAEIQLRPVDMATLREAFKMKYGDATESDDDSETWEGNDTIVKFDRDYEKVAITRKSVTEKATQLYWQRKDKMEQAKARRLEEMKKKF